MTRGSKPQIFLSNFSLSAVHEAVNCAEPAFLRSAFKANSRRANVQTNIVDFEAENRVAMVKITKTQIAVVKITKKKYNYINYS